MLRSPRTAAGPNVSLGVMLAVLALIVGTALAALAISARASGSSSKGLPCSLNDQGPLTAAQMRPGAPATPLVPEGAGVLTICNYNGLNATNGTPPFGLIGIDQTQRAVTIRRLTNELDAIGTTPQGAGYSCPFDDASQAILSFYYVSADVVVTMGTKGCNDITSGDIHRLGLGRSVIGQIERLTKPVKLQWARVVGRIRLCGGPAPGRCWTSGYGYCARRCVTADRVLATSSGNVWTAMGPVRKGRFRFSLAAPGTYTFELMADGRHVANRVLMKVHKRVAVGNTTRIVFTIPVP